MVLPVLLLIDLNDNKLALISAPIPFLISKFNFAKIYLLLFNKTGHSRLYLKEQYVLLSNRLFVIK
jgi:hypothetical protein